MPLTLLVPHSRDLSLLVLSPLLAAHEAAEPHYSYRLMYRIFRLIWIHQKHLITSNRRNVFNKLLLLLEQHFIFQSGGGNFFFLRTIWIFIASFTSLTELSIIDQTIVSP